MSKRLKLPLCCDCVHVVLDRTENGDDLYCGHPTVPPEDLSTGARPLARYVRWPTRQCGQSGRLFERAPEPPPPPRKFSLWERFRWRVWRWVRSR